MKSSDFQLRGVGDPRLAVHATSALPAWLWSIDGARVLWANPVGAKLFGAAHAAALAEKTFGPADAHRRQVAQLARRLPGGGAVRLERLRGFGASLGALMTCACARLEFADGGHFAERYGVLVTAMSTAGRTMPLVERLHRLVQGAEVPMAAFAPDGLFAGASEAARPLLGFRDLVEVGLDQARSDALAQGRVEMPIGIGHMVLQRVGLGADIGLIALIEPVTQQAARDAAPEAAEEIAPEAPVQPVQQAVATPSEPPPSNDISAGIPLFDAFAEPIETPDTTEPITRPPEPPAEVTAPDATPVHEPDEEPVEAAPKSPVENPLDAIVPPQAAPITSEMVEPPSGHAEPPAPHQHPLRFLWQMDAEGRFVLATGKFIRLIGARTAAGFGRPWHEIAVAFALDPEGRVAQALASHDT